MTKLTTIEGIGDALSRKLRGGGIGSAETLLRLGATRRGREQISDACNIDEGRVLKFVNHADLMRIKGVAGEYAELLEASGVDTVTELRNRNAENLAAKIARVNAEKRLIRSVPGSLVLSKWIDQAKTLDPVIRY